MRMLRGREERYKRTRGGQPGFFISGCQQYGLGLESRHPFPLLCMGSLINMGGSVAVVNGRLLRERPWTDNA